MQNFDLTNTEWMQVQNLTSGTTYLLTAKRKEVLAGEMQAKDFYPANILVAITNVTPIELDDGTLCQGIKFKKGSGNVYIRAIKLPCNITVQEV